MKKFILKNKYIVIFIIFFFIYISYVVINQEMKYRELINDRAMYNLEIEELKKSIDELYDVIDEISTPEYIEKMAREKLQMVKPDEIIYMIKD
ncbi:MAG: septum formation initiator family protein [Clostridiales bacterium]|nr:septum formation initiator family protein [Clostridiales bacterium]